MTTLAYNQEAVSTAMDTEIDVKINLVQSINNEVRDSALTQSLQSILVSKDTTSGDGELSINEAFWGVGPERLVPDETTNDPQDMYPVESEQAQYDLTSHVVFVHVVAPVFLPVLFVNERLVLRFKQNVYSESTLIAALLQKRGIPASKWDSFLFKLNGKSLSRSCNNLHILTSDDLVTVSLRVIGGKKTKSTVMRKVKNTMKDFKKGGISQIMNNNRKALRNTADAMVSKIFSAKYTAPVTRRDIEHRKKNVMVKLSKCSAKYAGLLLDPFNPLFFGACNPALTVAESEKGSASYGFDFNVGSNSVGFVLVFGGNAQNGVSCIYSQSGFAGSTATPCSANGTLTSGVNFTQNPQLKYNTGALRGTTATGYTAVQACNIGIACRVTYTGTTMNESGLIYCFADPNHNSVSGMSVNDIAARPESNVRPATRKPCTLLVHGIDSSLYPEGNIIPNGLNDAEVYYSFGNSTQNMATTYSGSTYYTYNDPGGITINCPTAVIMVTGVPGSSFHCDVIQHMNCIGIQASSGYSPHGTDVVGATQVQAALTELEALKKAHPDSTPIQLFKSALGRVQEGLKEIVIPATIETFERMFI